MQSLEKRVYQLGKGTLFPQIEIVEFSVLFHEEQRYRIQNR